MAPEAAPKQAKSTAEIRFLVENRRCVECGGYTRDSDADMCDYTRCDSCIGGSINAAGNNPGGSGG